MVDSIWIVTSYFNPCRYVTKRHNFELFATQLRSMGAQLLVVETARSDGEFELGKDHNVVRVRGDSFIWQKERLINLGTTNLPTSCTKVAWLDCDLLFEDHEWLKRTADALERFAVVQPFSSSIRLPRGLLEFRGQGQDGEQCVESFAAAFARDRSLAFDAVYRLHGHTGFAWAARRDLLTECGLYDACLTGSADHLMAHVFAGALNSQCIAAMIGSGHKYAEHFARWANRVHEICQGSLGHVPGRVLHLWHGAVADRRYYSRNQEFKKFDFDPDRHVRVGTNGLWEWADASREMRAWAMNVFESRNEDGDRPLDD
ncbi:MAG: hypothetical protein HOP13_01245 [Alphaproteobacteria bacterium]|nr:hypothetical protein [Alphaproteobacteria bacterium]